MDNNNNGIMKLKGIMYGKKEGGEKEELIGKEGRHESSVCEKDDTVRYSRAIHNIKRTFSIQKNEEKEYDNNNNNITKYNQDDELYNEDDESKYEDVGELNEGEEGSQDDDGLFSTSENIKNNKRLSKKNIKKTFGLKSPKKHSFGLKKCKVQESKLKKFEKSLFCYKEDEEDDEEACSNNLNNTYGMGRAMEGNLYSTQSKKKINKKETLIYDNYDDNDDDAQFGVEKKTKKKKKITKKLVKKVGSKTWSGVKIGCRFMYTGLRSMSLPFNSFGLTGGVTEALREWRVEVRKREELLAR